jgi:hypothetical protein
VLCAFVISFFAIASHKPGANIQEFLAPFFQKREVLSSSIDKQQKCSCCRKKIGIKQHSGRHVTVKATPSHKAT